jgi:hypothetical protein
MAAVFVPTSAAPDGVGCGLAERVRRSAEPSTAPVSGLPDVAVLPPRDWKVKLDEDARAHCSQTIGVAVDGAAEPDAPACPFAAADGMVVGAGDPAGDALEERVARACPGHFDPA